MRVGANFALSYLGERLWLGGKWAHFRKVISRSTCICNIIPSYENYASLTASKKISRTGHCLADGTFTYCCTLDHYHLDPQSNLYWQMIALNGYLLLTRINRHEYTQGKQGSLTNRLADGTLFWTVWYLPIYVEQLLLVWYMIGIWGKNFYYHEYVEQINETNFSDGS